MAARASCDPVAANPRPPDWMNCAVTASVEDTPETSLIVLACQETMPRLFAGGSAQTPPPGCILTSTNWLELTGTQTVSGGMPEL